MVQDPWTPANLSGCAFLLKIIVCFSVQIGFHHFHPDERAFQNFQFMPWNVVIYSVSLRTALTVIRAAGGVFDFGNIEQEQLSIALSNKNFFNSCILQKMSREYIF
jgi:hypothetical protein